MVCLIVLDRRTDSLGQVCLRAVTSCGEVTNAILDTTVFANMCREQQVWQI